MVSVFISGFLAPDVTDEPAVMTDVSAVIGSQPFGPQLLLLLMAGLAAFTHRPVQAVRQHG